MKVNTREHPELTELCNQFKYTTGIDTAWLCEIAAGIEARESVKQTSNLLLPSATDHAERSIQHWTRTFRGITLAKAEAARLIKASEEFVEHVKRAATPSVKEDMELVMKTFNKVILSNNLYAASELRAALYRIADFISNKATDR